ncbi:hypothetical protein EKO04_009300 [Ascochyta lentis]|uniref:Uncharacterized protein n=1 Tax=Ascochyta lentis TaxID=205686 RepID=A0A8H7MFE6_9PLEO|nr:hypothetical protein EKO04_009300 [Ascochyta lentis]
MAGLGTLEPLDDDFAVKSNAHSLTHLSSPSDLTVDFIQGLASQIQLLACLKWLGEFQVLTLVPLHGSILTAEAAEIAGVPVEQLSRVVRLVATSGFLHEPQPDRIAHTKLSSAFVSTFSFLDAVMFLAESAVPTALHMTAATHRAYQHPDLPAETAYSIAVNTSQSFESACDDQPRLQRQWCAYRRYASCSHDSFIDILRGLNWRSLGSATVVDVAAHSTEVAVAIADVAPAIHIVVQLIQPTAVNNKITSLVDEARRDINDRIEIHKKISVGAQLVTDASIYILRLEMTSSMRSVLLAELTAHLGLLRANPAATLIVAPPLLLEPGIAGSNMEAQGRLRDLYYYQLTGEYELELNELIKMIKSTHDKHGRLVVINQLRCGSGATGAVSVKYEFSTPN